MSDTCPICGHGKQTTELAKEECRIIKAAMIRNGMNMTHAAPELGYSVSTLKRRLLEHGLREKGVPIVPRVRRIMPRAVPANNGIEPS